jgi:DNA-binding IclR family transcriptional regulator
VNTQPARRRAQSGSSTNNQALSGSLIEPEEFIVKIIAFHFHAPSDSETGTTEYDQRMAPRNRPANSPPRRTLLSFDEWAGDKQFATTLARGLELLRCFTPEHPVQGNTDLARKTGLPKATVSRLTYTLSNLGYLTSTLQFGKFQLAPAVVSLGYPLLAAFKARQLIRPAIREFSAITGGSVSLGVRDRLNIVYVETSRSSSVFSSNLSDIGMSHPIIATAIGRAYLAACNGIDRKRLLNQIKLKAPQLWERHSRAALKSVELFAKLGFVASYRPLRPEAQAVAVPFRLSSYHDIVVKNCVLHVSQLRPNQLEEDIGPRLVSVVQGLNLV